MKMKQDDVNIPLAEMRALREIEEILQIGAALRTKADTQFRRLERIELSYRDVVVVIENDTVVALSVRYAALMTLPNSIDLLTNLRELDLTGNLLMQLPDEIGNLAHLQKLYLDCEVPHS
jgi:Leucine-rich repeat (LRR) protein